MFQTSPSLLTASSGSMLILLYSDTNYVMEGAAADGRAESDAAMG